MAWRYHFDVHRHFGAYNFTSSEYCSGSGIYLRSRTLISYLGLVLTRSQKTKKIAENQNWNLIGANAQF